MKINFNEAKKFLENISEKDRIALLFHNDIDGFVAGILLADWCENKGAKIKPIPFTMTDDQNRAIKEIGDRKKIITADLAPTAIIKILKAIKDRDVFYTDHHISEIKIPDEIKKYETPSSTSSSRAIYQLIGGREFLRIMSEVADAGWRYEENRKEIDKFLKEKNWTLNEFFRKVKYPYDRTIIYFHKDLVKAFEILKEINSTEDIKKLKEYDSAIGDEINRFVKEFSQKSETLGKVHFYYFKPEHPIKSAIINEISYANPNKTFIFAVPNGDEISISARNQNKKQSMVELLKKATKNIPIENLGGHVPAAGARIKRKHLEKFKENLKNC